MKNSTSRFFLACTFVLAAAATIAVPSARADDASPVGLWKSIDDVTGQPKSLVRISESNGELSGRIEKLFRPSHLDQSPRCTLCEGARKDQPVIGMVFMTGLKKTGDEFGGGEIVDPDSGKVYKSKIALIEGGKKLKVRGYIGVPMFGRSQVWVRQE